MVRIDMHDGSIAHFEGENGAKRIVRMVYSDGDILFFEGEKGAERVVRKEAKKA